MSVNKELLERYHLDACSVEECREIEEWLFNNEGNDLKLSAGADKNALKSDIWKNIQSDLPEEPLVTKTRSNSYYMWKGAIAASIFFFLSGIIVYSFNPSKIAIVNLNNSSAAQVRQVSSGGYNVAVGPNTTASINDEMHVIDLNGSLLISTEKDVELVFEGTGKKVNFKKGQTYIILKNREGAKDIIMVNKENLLDLPPIMQRQINTHFDI